MKNTIYRLLKISFLAFILPLFFMQTTMAKTDPHGEGEKEFKPGETIMHHIADAHEWHFTTIAGKHITLPLPVIIYSEQGLDVFLSSAFHHSDKVSINDNTYVMEHGHIHEASGKKIYDFSITKNVASLIISVILLLLIFTAVARGFKRNHGKAPRGIQSFLEPIIVFVRDEIAKPNIGPKYEKYMPFLLTVFFFIWINNLLGLIPGGANLTGNIAVTLVLATLTLIITLFSSNKNYWNHIFATPGVPKWLLPIMIPVELLGVLTKPFSLMIRLFANITAGHIIILSLFSLIFIFKSVAVGPVSVAFSVFMSCLELLVAVLQAYVFTLLSAMYFGQAVEEHDHEEAH